MVWCIVNQDTPDVAAGVGEIVDNDQPGFRVEGRTNYIQKHQQDQYMGSVFTMEQGSLLQNQLPLHTEYSLQSAEHDCMNHFSGHAHHPPYGNNGTVDQLQRDGTLPQQAPSTFLFTASNHAHGARFVPDRAVASDATSYQQTGNFTDSSSGSISTSPSSAASSLAYTNYPANHYTSLPTFSGPVTLPQPFVPSSHAATRVPSIFDVSTSGMLPNPTIRSPISISVNGTDRDVFATSTPFINQARSQLSPLTHHGYEHYPHTPRTVLSGTPSLSFSADSANYSSHMAAAGGYGSSSNECLNFPWPNLEIVADMTCEGQAVTPEVHAKVEKGFFLAQADSKWTCYRRNYFSVSCYFELHPNINNGRMYLKRNNNSEQIQAMGMRLSAAVDGSSGKSVELIQHTPKRDNGPKTKIDVTRVSPTPSTGRGEHATVSPHGIYQVPMATFHATGAVPGPFLPLQNTGDGNSSASTNQPPQLSTQYPYSASAVAHLPSGQITTQTFERVQFKQATANNGKRRASQQYFHLIVELFADIRKEGSETPVWVKVAQRVSEKIVVRGRSPSHYQNEGQHGQGGRGGSTSGGSGYSTTSGASYGSVNAGGFRTSSNGYTSSIGGSGGYRANQYGLHASSEGSGSSPGSVDEGVVNVDHPMGTVMSDAERAGIQEYEGYQYYPSTIYESVPNNQLPPLAKIEGVARFSSESRLSAVKAEYANAVPGSQWQTSGCGRFQGVETSRGYYPDLSAGFS